MKQRSFLACTALASVWAVSMPARAQAQEGSEEIAPLSAGDIVVTARRREERLQDVPVAVTALTGDQLREKAVLRLDDLATNTPSFQQMTTNFGKSVPSFTIRSQRQQNNNITQDPSVGIYFADVVQVHSQGVNGAMYDLASVQVLKGPQGTLFGRNTTGGAVVITPQVPTDRLEGYASLTLGSYRQRIGEAVLNLPVSDILQLRFSGQINRRDGYATNLYDGAKLEDDHTDAWRVSVRFSPIDAIENRLVLNGFHVDENGAAIKLTGISAPATTRNAGLAPFFANSLKDDFYTVNSQYPTFTDIHTFNVSNITTIDLGDVTLKNIFGYRYVYFYGSIDQDGSPFELLETQNYFKERQYSNEFQVIGKALDGGLDYILGAYYFKENGFEIATSANFGVPRFSTTDASNVSKSVFGQLSYKLPFAPAVSLTGGLRQTWDDRYVNYLTTAGIPATCALLVGETGSAVVNPCSVKGSKSYKKPTYTLSADWHINSNVLVYVAHRQGYRTGGFQQSARTASQREPFQPEVVKDFEFGLKTDWRIGQVRGRFNLAAYHQKYTNIQRQQARVIDGIFYGAVVVNAAAARMNGVEVEAMISPVPSLELSVFYAYADPKYTDYTQPLSATVSFDSRNAPFAGAPKHSGGFTLRWNAPIPQDMGQLTTSVRGYFQSLTYGSDGSFDRVLLKPYPAAKIDAYHIIDARIEWQEIAGSPFELAFHVKNLLNRRYYNSGLDLTNPAVGLGITNRHFGEPRTISVQATYKF